MFIWDVQYFCPLRCAYCYSNSGPSQAQTSLEQLWAVARAIARERPEAVMISGGEPALAKGIEEIAAFLRSHGASLSMFTSGWGLDEARIERLANVFDRIHVSIDSADSVINDHIRGRAGAHKNASNTLRLLGACKKHVPKLRFGVDCMVVTTNLGGVIEYCEFVGRFDGLDFINISPAIPSGRASHEDFSLLISGEDVSWLLSRAVEIRKSLPSSITLSIHKNDFLKTDDDRWVQINARGEVRAIKICEKTVGTLVEEPLSVLLERAEAWRAASPLARKLPIVTDYPAWREVVRSIDREAFEAARPLDQQ